MVKRILFVVVILSLVVCSKTFCQTKGDFPSLEPHVVFDYDSTNLSSRQIIEVALAFSECPVLSDNSKYLQMYDELEKRVSTKYFKSLSQRDQAEEILLMMYEKTLRRYSLKQTKLTTMFDDGTYNCVSASVLYMALAKAAGLNVIGNRAPDHCFCSVIIDGVKYDVETTNPMGFNPGEKKMIDQNGSGTKYATVPKKTYNGRYEISLGMLVALVARNVSAFEIDRRNYSVAVPVAVSRLVFLRNEKNKSVDDSRADFDLVVSNYAAELQRKKNYYDSMQWMDLAVERWGISDGLKINYGDSIYNGILFMSNNGQLAEAKTVLDSKKEFVSDKDYKELSLIIFIQDASKTAEQISDFDEKISYLRSKRNDPLASEKNGANQLNVLIENAWIVKISESLNKNKFLEAASLADLALKDLPSSSKLKNIKQTSLNNYDVTVHNKFADLANKKNFSEAKRVLEEGLNNHPESSTLKNDMNRLSRMMN